MKKLFKALGTIAVLAVILSFAACDGFDLSTLTGGKTGGDNNGGSTTGSTTDSTTGSTAGIKTLKLSGQVYVGKKNDDPPSISFEKYEGDDLTVYAEGLDETGTIKNGQLSITLGTPTDLFDIGDASDDDDGDITISTSGVKGFQLESLYIENSDGRQMLQRGNAVISSSTSYTVEEVLYFYVDKDVTMSAKEKTETIDYSLWGGGILIYTTKAFKLALKAGWNTVYRKAQSSINESSNTSEEITTISLANPSSLKWVLDDSYSSGGGSEGGGGGGSSNGGDDDDDEGPTEPTNPPM